MYETAREEFILKWLKLLKKLNRKLQKEIFFFSFSFFFFNYYALCQHIFQLGCQSHQVVSWASYLPK